MASSPETLEMIRAGLDRRRTRLKDVFERAKAKRTPPEPGSLAGDTAEGLGQPSPALSHLEKLQGRLEALEQAQASPGAGGQPNAAPPAALSRLMTYATFLERAQQKAEALPRPSATTPAATMPAAIPSAPARPDPVKEASTWQPLPGLSEPVPFAKPEAPKTPAQERADRQHRQAQRRDNFFSSIGFPQIGRVHEVLDKYRSYQEGRDVGYGATQQPAGHGPPSPVAAGHSGGFASEASGGVFKEVVQALRDLIAELKKKNSPQTQPGQQPGIQPDGSFVPAGAVPMARQTQQQPPAQSAAVPPARVAGAGPWMTGVGRALGRP